VLAEAVAVPREHQVPPGGERRPVRETVLDALPENPAAQIGRPIAGIVKLDPLEVIEIVGRMVENLVDDDLPLRRRRRSGGNEQDGEDPGRHEEAPCGDTRSGRPPTGRFQPRRGRAPGFHGESGRARRRRLARL